MLKLLKSVERKRNIVFSPILKRIRAVFTMLIAPHMHVSKKSKLPEKDTGLPGQ